MEAGARVSRSLRKHHPIEHECSYCGADYWCEEEGPLCEVCFSCQVSSRLDRLNRRYEEEGEDE